MSHRRANHRGSSLHSRRLHRCSGSRQLTAERLEDRRLMAAAELGKLFAEYQPDHRSDHGLVSVSPTTPPSAYGHSDRADALHQRHFINGRWHDMAAIPAPVEDAVGQSSLAIASVLHPLTSIPVLNSLPGAAATLYLDFNGHFQATYGMYSNVTTPVYDSDGDESTFSDAELAFISDLWADVVEDFAPFNINVTTVEPALLAPGASESAANGKALRVAFGGVDMAGQGAAGRAYIDAFTSSIANVAYVFATGVTNSIAYATIAAHEAGHAFGLQHQTGAYYDSAARTSAIMGPTIFGYEHTYWHNGSIEGGAQQDDMAQIARAANGFGYRADDRGNTVSAATPMTNTGSGFTASGIVGTNSDVDVFSIAATGSYIFTLEGHAPGQNLDAVLELRSSTGAVLHTANPGDSLDASLIGDVAGTGYIAVRSTGAYGRVGQYTLTAAPSAAGIAVTRPRGPLTTSESGRSESLSMSLTARPAANVTFAISSSDVTEGTVSIGSITFTPDNWYSPQIVTITGATDSEIDGAQSYAVSISPAASLDPAYDGLTAGDNLSLVNLDAAPGQVYWVRSNISSDLAVVERSSLAGDGFQTALNIKDALGAAPAGYHSPNRLTIDAVAGKMYWSDSSNKTINRAKLDGSGAQIVMTLANAPSDVAIDPFGGKIYWTDAVLDKIQRANLDGSGVQDVIAAGLTAPSGLELDLVGGKLYWSDNTTYTINRANLDGTGVEVIRNGDGVNLPQSITLDVLAGKIYYGLRQNFLTQQLYRSNLDGSGEEMLVDLNALDPSTPNPVVQGIAIDHDGGRIIWSQSFGQRVYSADLDGDNVAVIFEGTIALRGIAFLPATPGVTVTPATGVATTEGGGAASFTVVLNTPPTADVTIPLATSDVSEGAVSLASLTFTPSNWSKPQTVTVIGRNDSFADGDKSYSVVLGPATSADPAYAGFNVNDVSIVNIDDELQTVTVANATSATIPDRGSITSTINLSASGTLLDLDVRVNISHGWNEDLDVTLIAPDGTRIELFTDVGGASSNFTNTVLDDEATQAITAGAGPFTGRYRPEGNLTSLEGKNAAGVWRLEVKDDARWIDGALIDWAITARTMSGLPNPTAIVTPTAGLVTTEGGGTASFTVRLDAQPAANVTIPVSTSDVTEGVPSVSSLTFTPSNWNVPQTIVVSGVDDTTVDGAVAYTIVLGSAASADPDFAGLNPVDVSVSNGDNDLPTTKFYVVDDGSANRTYEYAAAGSAIENYATASANSAPRGVASTVAGDRVWVIDANRNVYVYDTSGSLLGSWTAGTLASNALPEDITVYGSDVWIVDRQSDRVYRYAGAATRLSGSQAAVSNFVLNSSNGSATGLVTDGASIWVVDDSSTNRVFKYTTTGSLLGSWTIASANSTPTGITIDPSNVSDIWIVDSGSDRVYQYTAAAGRTSGSQNAATSFALSSGNTNPQGIADPPSGAKSLNDHLVGPSWSDPRLTLPQLLRSDGSREQRTPRPVRERHCETAAATTTAVFSLRSLLSPPSQWRDSEVRELAEVAIQEEVGVDELDYVFSKLW